MNTRSSRTRSKRTILTFRTPPMPNRYPIHRQTKVQQHSHERQPRVQSRGQHVVIPLPPLLVVLEHKVIEHNSNYDPAVEVHARRRRHRGRRAQKNREIDLRDPCPRRKRLLEKPH